MIVSQSTKTKIKSNKIRILENVHGIIHKHKCIKENWNFVIECRKSYIAQEEVCRAFLFPHNVIGNGGEFSQIFLSTDNKLHHSIRSHSSAKMIIIYLAVYDQD